MSPEQTPSPVSFSCKLLLDVRAEIDKTKVLQREDTRLIVGADQEPLPKPTKPLSRLRESKARNRAVAVYCTGFETHETLLSELRSTEERLLGQIREEAHSQLMQSDTEYRDRHHALRGPLQVLHHVDYAATLGRRASELITRATVRFNHDTANKVLPCIASTANYVHTANSALDRLVVQLYCGVMPVLHAQGETPDPWELLPVWNAEKKRVDHPKFYHLVGWCLEVGTSFTHPQRGMVTGINLADQRLTEYRRRYRAIETTESGLQRVAQDKLIEQWLTAAKSD